MYNFEKKPFYHLIKIITVPRSTVNVHLETGMWKQQSCRQPYIVIKKSDIIHGSDKTASAAQKAVCQDEMKNNASRLIEKLTKTELKNWFA